jgi:hypothetical protein
MPSGRRVKTNLTEAVSVLRGSEPLGFDEAKAVIFHADAKLWVKAPTDPNFPRDQKKRNSLLLCVTRILSAEDAVADQCMEWLGGHDVLSVSGCRVAGG